MPVKLSEKKLLFSIFCLAAGALLLYNTSLIPAPVRVSEKGIVYFNAAFIFIISGLRFLKRAMVRI